MSPNILTVALALALAQAPHAGTGGFPELKTGAVVRLTTGRETITGTVEEGVAGEFLRLKVAGTSGSTYVRRSAVETIRVLPERPAGAPEAATAAAARAPDPNRYVVYVHGICRHAPGFSTAWFNAMKGYTPQVVAANVREVVWSDIVNPSMAGARPPGMEAAPAPPASRTPQQRQLAESLRAIILDRAAQDAAASGAAVGATPGPEAPAPGAAGMAGPEMAAAGLFGGLFEAAECANDFVLYMTVPSTRDLILARFDAVVRPLLESGASVEIISHSWGTVIAYEGLRRIDAQSSAAVPGTVHNLFTVGSALSIWLVRLNLADRFPGGARPRTVTRWVNLDARFDPVGGHIQGAPFDVDVEQLDLAPVGCSFPITPTCAHGSYFEPSNVVVNRDIFGRFIGR